MRYLHRVNHLQCNTGAQKTAVFAELVILQPQRTLQSIEYK
jgi:hypothetical protein